MGWLTGVMIGAAAPGAAVAQYTMVSPMLYEGPRISLQNSIRRTPKPTTSAPRSPSVQLPVATAADGRSLTYVPDKARRRANMARIADSMRSIDPAGADKLAALFAATDVIDQMRAPLGKVGLNVDNVADCYAVWWINAWQASRGRNEDVSAATAMAVRAQVARAMMANPAMLGASAPAKQQMAESLLIQAWFASDAVEQSKRDPAMLKKVGEMIAKGGQAMGIDLMAIELTERGFEPR